MKANKASRTAQYMALFRALETTRPENSRLFKDPYAVSFLNSKHKLVTKLSAFSPARTIIENIIHSKIPGAYSSGLARTKYIDDLLQQSVHNGIQQVIILGAGFDTRALRLPFLATIPVIEIDHPNTAKLKLEVLRQKFSELPRNIRYIQTDFNSESLETLAIKHSINFAVPTCIIWEGVSNYLDAQAIHNTFAFTAKFAIRSTIIFTYVNKQVLDDPGAFYGAVKLLNDLVAIEEKWTFGFNPGELAQYLQPFKLLLKEDKGASEYRNDYIPRRTEKGYEFYRVAMAERV
jgi:methyltransferase (TIGR00027 family)